MLVGERSGGGGGGGGGSINLKRTSSMRGINTELSSNTQTLEEPTIVTDTTPHFLTTCSLCRSPLAAGRDIYMYRGDTAFCSLECREEQMKQDKRNYQWNKLKASSKQQDPSPPSSSATAAAKSHTLAAA